MGCGIEEYWLVDPEDKHITIYHFKGKEIQHDVRYGVNDVAGSYAFPDLMVPLAEVFA